MPISLNLAVPRDPQKPQDYGSDGTDAIGFVHFWGISPALDLLGKDPQKAAFGPAAVGVTPGGYYKEAAEKEKPKDEDSHEQGEDAGEGDDGEMPEVREDCTEPALEPLTEGDGPVNVLIAGGCDIRHLVKTLAKHRRRTCGDSAGAEGVGAGRRVRFFLHDNNPEVLARHMLFLQILNNKALPIRERMETFLSLYGNTLVREKDVAYVADIAPEFVELVTDNSEHPLTRVIDLSHLKFKDRDALQDVIKGWFKEVPFDAEALREQRCRGFYRDRYDHRKNMMDLYFHNAIRGQAGVISWYHYKEFCHTGVAFESRLASYNSPNRTLASFTEAVDRKKGGLVQARGYWGDIINSPYHAFGTTADVHDRARLFKISNQQYRHNETDIAEFNVTAFLNEMETGHAFHLPPERPEEHEFPYASPLDELQKDAPKIEEVKDDDAKKSGDAKGGAAGKAGERRRGKSRKTAADWPPLVEAFENTEVVLLTGDLKEVLMKSKYRGLFHRAFVGCMSVLPLFEEMELTKNSTDPFMKAEESSGRPAGQIRKPPRLEAPELFGTRRGQCSLAGAMAGGAEVIFETMKYQATFEGSQKGGFRHRIAQVGHLAGWRLADERHAVPRLERGQLETRMRDVEKDAADFMRFVTAPAPSDAPAPPAETAAPA